MAKEQGQKGFLERAAGTMERLNYALGAVAVGGALLFPEAAPVLIAFAGLQLVEGMAWKWLKDRKANKQKTKIGKLATASA